jgi:hypothetical protein
MQELDGGNTLELNGGLHISLAVAAPPRKEVFFRLHLASNLSEAADT